MGSEGEKILVVDDEPAELETLAEILESMGDVITAPDGETAVQMALDYQPGVVISDLVLPGEIDGMKLLQFCRERLPDTPVILITGHATVETAIEAMKSGAYDYLVKPIDVRRLRALVNKALEHHRIAAERTRLLETIDGEGVFQGMIGVSPQMREVFRRIKAVAPTDSTVLILGESGTGKELVAEAIHNLSPRTGKLVKINCSAIPENLLESELFGYEKGAFTGATRRKPGKFEIAHSGTLFLDEIGDMPPALQAKLLRVIETGEVEPLGAREPIKVDVRIIAATNKNLPELIKTGKFRDDLYYRLSVFTIELPPLRERPEDIPPLVAFFLKKLSAKFGRKIKGVSRDVMDAFVNYPWEGNVRQLRNALEEMVILSEGEVLDRLPSFMAKKDESFPVEGTLEDLERRAIENALKKTRGNKSKAARLLGIGLRTLYRKIEKYKIDV